MARLDDAYRLNDADFVGQFDLSKAALLADARQALADASSPTSITDFEFGESGHEVE